MKKKFLLLVFVFLLLPFSVNASTSYVINDKASTAKSCSIKTKPNEEGEYLIQGKIHWLDPGDTVILVDDTKVKSTNEKCSTDYYYVTYAGNKGYVCGDYINFSNDGTYYEELRSKGFPESYLQPLNALKEQYPNWNFIAYQTGINFEEAVSKQSIVGKSYIQVTDPNGKDSIYLSLDGLSYDAETKTFKQMEVGGWYAANKATVAYYMDVRNFLNSRDIYMFEVSTYNEKNQTKEAVESIFKNTDLLQYAPEYIKAATDSGNNISPTMLATRSRQEVVIAGGKLSNAANGSKEYYNFFNLGSLSSCINPVLCGNDFAAGKGWTTASSAISGGASYINDNYVSKEQNSLYFQKFNVTRTNTHSHQYMTNIDAPKSEANYLYKGYSGANTINAETNFIIPVYNNMPNTVSALPTTMNQEDLDNANSSTQQPEKNTLDIATIVNGAGYRYNNSYISNINIGTNASALISKLKSMSNDAEVIIINNSNKQISNDEILGTGYVVKITNNNKTETLKIVIYGDVNGDGNVTVVDLLKVQKHILNTENLSDSYKEAADANKDHNITVVDLLAVQKQVLGTASIKQ